MTSGRISRACGCKSILLCVHLLWACRLLRLLPFRTGLSTSGESLGFSYGAGEIPRASAILWCKLRAFSKGDGWPLGPSQAGGTWNGEWCGGILRGREGASRKASFWRLFLGHRDLPFSRWHGVGMSFILFSRVRIRREGVVRGPAGRGGLDEAVVEGDLWIVMRNCHPG